MGRMLPSGASVILLFSLLLTLVGPGLSGLAAPVFDAGFAAPTAESGAVPRFEQAPCPWKLPKGQVEGQTVRCGFAVVAEQHRDPTGPTIRLPVAVFKSTSGAPAVDPIVYLQGGPGGAVDDFITGFLDENLGAYTANRDLIVFDQRGVGFAQPTLECPEVTAQDLADAALKTSPTEKTSHDITAVATCRDRLTRQGINLSAYTSAEGAADVNDIRAVLGYGTVDLLGVSYGTRVALTVMRDFPGVVRSAVLDSSVPLQANLVEDNGVNFERAFNLYFAACAADPSCNAKSPTLQADYVALVAQLNDQPVTTTVTDMRTKKTTPVVVDGSGLTFLISEMLYDQTATGYIPLLIDQVKAGKTQALNLLLSVFGVTGADINVGAYFSVLCSEELPFNNRDRAAAAAAGLTPELQELFANDVREHFDVCAQWPTQPVNPAETQPVTSDIPALVLSSDNDPATPPSYGEQTARTLAKGFLITFPGIGHSVLANGGECGLNTIFAFINDPTTRPSTECVGKKGS